MGVESTPLAVKTSRRRWLALTLLRVRDVRVMQPLESVTKEVALFVRAPGEVKTAPTFTGVRDSVRGFATNQATASVESPPAAALSCSELTGEVPSSFGGGTFLAGRGRGEEEGVLLGTRAEPRERGGAGLGGALADFAVALISVSRKNRATTVSFTSSLPRVCEMGHTRQGVGNVFEATILRGAAGVACAPAPLATVALTGFTSETSTGTPAS
jgi:hypothetical protein